MPIQIAALGGDLRHVRLVELLAADGFPVRAFGMDAAPPAPPVVCADTPAEALRGADCVLLPLPVTGEGGAFYAPLACRGLSVEELLDDALRPGQLVLAGRVLPELRTQFATRGLTLVDYHEREELAVANAVPTAEGAIQIAMEELPVTLHGARCLVIGFGRIGKVLAKALHGLGARVTVSARRVEDFAWIRAYGYECADTRSLEGAIGDCDVIFNTVPHRVLPRERLALLKPGCLCVDLASKPGGVDFAAAAELGVNCVWALSLPGKVAPHTSGGLIRDCLTNIFKERGLLP